MYNTDTIVAQATAPGRAGIGILRISGANVSAIAQHILGHLPQVRMAQYLPFHDENKQILDQGIALFFQGPNSFTGEDILELQGHGGPVVLDLLLQAILHTGLARLAKPGEFSERAFLNDKIDLVQAEAIADLIESSSAQAARLAMQSLRGDFSKQIQQLIDALISLRVYIEAAIDFPEEEIDFLNDGKIQTDLEAIQAQLINIQKKAQQGALMREGMTVVIAGRPNAGKSSLLNRLSGHERAIVTDVAGTTRDTLTEHIHLDGMPLHIIDTAGLRETNDVIEKIGVARAWQAIEKADRVLLVVDSSTAQYTDPMQIWPAFTNQLPTHIGLTIVHNKIDLRPIATHHTATTYPVIQISAKTGQGIAQLTEHLKTCMGYQPTGEGQLMARRRHLDALAKAGQHLQLAWHQLTDYHAGELVAEELRLAADELGKITGKMSADDLLGEIFSSFCIGK